MTETISNKTYRYKNKLYVLTPFQQEIYKRIESLTHKRLYYITLQQTSNPKKRNLNLKELKNFIRRGIRKYFRENHPTYQPDLENELVKFYCVFETDKTFNQTQRISIPLKGRLNLGLHFHLFLSCPDHLPWFSIQKLSERIKWELTSLKHKRDCISEYELTICEGMSDNISEKEIKTEYSLLPNYTKEFILYHTKQFFNRPSREMVMSN